MYELFIPINNSKFQTMDKFEMLLTEDVKVLQTSFLCLIYIFPVINYFWGSILTVPQQHCYQQMG